MKIKYGFTLIELLVVMAIIGILSAASLFALSGTRESARDSARKADLESIRSALELYKSDCGGYPAAAALTFGSALNGDGVNCSASNQYIPVVPQDSMSGRVYVYTPAVPPNSYTLCAALEGTTTAVSSCGTGCTETCSYKVVNP